MDNLEKNQTPATHFVLGQEDFIAKDAPRADFAAMQPEFPERSWAPSIVVLVLAFLGSFHLLGNLIIPNYGQFLGFHLLSVSLGGFAIALLAGMHVYSKRLRDFR